MLIFARKPQRGTYLPLALAAEVMFSVPCVLSVKITRSNFLLGHVYCQLWEAGGTSINSVFIFRDVTCQVLFDMNLIWGIFHHRAQYGVGLQPLALGALTLGSPTASLHFPTSCISSIDGVGMSRFLIPALSGSFRRESNSICESNGILIAIFLRTSHLFVHLTNYNFLLYHLGGTHKLDTIHHAIWPGGLSNEKAGFSHKVHSQIAHKCTLSVTLL